MFVVSFLILKF